MSVTRRVVFGTGSIWINRILAAVLGMTLIPVLFRTLPQEELGLWFLLAQAGGFVGLLDFGFTLTFTRRIAILSGKGDEEGLRDVMATGRVVYRVVAVLVLLLGLGLGYVFLSGLDVGDVGFERLLLAWAILCAAHAVNAWAGLWHCALNGLGHVGWDALVATATNVLVALAQIAVALAGGGLTELAIVTAIGAVAGRQVIVLFVRSKEPQALARTGTYQPELVRELRAFAWRGWLTTLGAFLILKTDQYFIAWFRGAADIPAYHALYQLVAYCFQVAVAFAAASAVFVSQAWSAGRIADVHRLTWTSAKLGLGLMACGLAFVLVTAPEFLRLWLGPDHFVGYAVLVTFCIAQFLEAQHVILAHACRATEEEPFAFWAMGAGALNLVLTLVLIGPLGLWGVALGTLIAQLLTNNWYAVRYALRRLELPFGQYVRQVSLPVLAVFGVALMTTFAGAELGRAAGGDLGTVLCGALGTGIVLIVFCWFVGLSSDTRRMVLTRLRSGNPTP